MKLQSYECVLQQLKTALHLYHSDCKKQIKSSAYDTGSGFGAEGHRHPLQ